jgi:hypothetical protein
MDRRDSLKTLLVGSIGGVAISASLTGCEPEVKKKEEVKVDQQNPYGRTPNEIKRDSKLKLEIFLNNHELATIAILCDIILPANDNAGSATDAGVPEFIEFIVKDLPSHQIPMRGGLMWLDSETNGRFNLDFISCSDKQQIEVIEDIAYPDPNGNKKELAQGIAFFDRIRNLTVTGYYTTKMGINDLGYKGNFANIWDGVPEEVLKDHEVDYDPDWLAKCVDQSKRDVIAEWDNKGNLLT